MADFIGNRYLKKNNIPYGAFVIFDGGKFYRGCSLANESETHQQCIIENGILKLKVLESKAPEGFTYTEYRIIVNQSPESGTGKTPNNFGVDIEIPTPSIISSEYLTLYGSEKTYRITTPWNEKKVYHYGVKECGETSFKVIISVRVAEGQSTTVGQTLLGIRSIWYE